MPGLIEAAGSLRERVEGYRRAQFRASDHLRVWHYAIGLTLIAISAVVSGSALQASGDGGLTLLAGTLSIGVVVLTSVQTTFKPAERAELHRSAANGFGKIRTELDIFIRRPHPQIDEAWDELAVIAGEIGGVEAGAPGYLRRTHDRASMDAQRELHDRRRSTAERVP